MSDGDGDQLLRLRRQRATGEDPLLEGLKCVVDLGCELVARVPKEVS
jgi:hypothetical protein